MLVVGRDEDDVRRQLPVEHPARDLKAAQAGHLDVEKHDVRPEPVDCRERFHAVAGLADHVDAAKLSRAGSPARHEPAVHRRQGPHANPSYAVTRSGIVSSGISTRAHVPSPGRAGELQAIGRAVDRAQSLVDVAQADAAAEGFFKPIAGHPQPVVVHFDDRMAILHPAADRDASAADLRETARA